MLGLDKVKTRKGAGLGIGNCLRPRVSADNLDVPVLFTETA